MIHVLQQSQLPIEHLCLFVRAKGVVKLLDGYSLACRRIDRFATRGAESESLPQLENKRA